MDFPFAKWSLKLVVKAIKGMRLDCKGHKVAVWERLIEESLMETLVDLEQLKETRFHAAYGIKAEKLRCKKWFG